MREISEAEAWAMARDAECPVLGKEESDPLEAAVCLKQFPSGYILGISDKVNDLLILFTEDRKVAEEQYQRYVAVMRDTGTPFGNAAT